MIEYDRLFRESYKRILGGTTSQENEFFDAFYEAFIASSPLIAEKFQGVDMAAQKTMLKQSLIHLVNLYATRQIPEPLIDIARKHGKTGADIPPQLYQSWMECLVATARTFDPRFNDDTELAWRLVCSQGIALMTFMAER